MTQTDGTEPGAVKESKLTASRLDTAAGSEPSDDLSHGSFV